MAHLLQHRVRRFWRACDVSLAGALSDLAQNNFFWKLLRRKGMEKIRTACDEPFEKIVGQVRAGAGVVVQGKLERRNYGDELTRSELYSCGDCGR